MGFFFLNIKPNSVIKNSQCLSKSYDFTAATTDSNYVRALCVLEGWKRQLWCSALGALAWYPGNLASPVDGGAGFVKVAQLLRWWLRERPWGKPATPGEGSKPKWILGDLREKPLWQKNHWGLGKSPEQCLWLCLLVI